MGMTFLQAAAIVIVTAMAAAFVWGRWRYDIIALTALLASVAVGTVPQADAFTGFSDDIVIIVASALVISRAMAGSGLVNRLVRPSLGWLTTEFRQVAALSTIVLVMSAFVKNIGALSMTLPAAYQFRQRSGTPVSRLLMPMSFASLLGGITTLVGTSPNIITSRLREQLTGESFAMFDFAIVGVPLALLGLIYIQLCYRLVPLRKTPSLEDVTEHQAYTVEALVPPTAAALGKPAQQLAETPGADIEVVAIVRKNHTRIRNPVEQLLHEDDHVLLHGTAEDIDRVIRAHGLVLPQGQAGPRTTEEGTVSEAVVGNESLLIGWSPSQLRLADRFAIEVIGVRRRHERVQARLKSYRFAAGDVVVVRSTKDRLSEALSELDLLPLAFRENAFRKTSNPLLLIGILAVAMVLMAIQVVPVPLVFLGAAVLMVASGALTFKETYDALDPIVLVTLAALIPVSASLHGTGVTALLSHWLASHAAALPHAGAIALIMATAMLLTPFLNNAATVLVAAPVAAAFAKDLGLAPEPFLMAVAVGAACDFLTPVGHQCNMLVMGPGGYRFSDYWRLGLPLSLLVLIAGVPLILWAWPP